MLYSTITNNRVAKLAKIWANVKRRPVAKFKSALTVLHSFARGYNECFLHDVGIDLRCLASPNSVRWKHVQSKICGDPVTLSHKKCIDDMPICQLVKKFHGNHDLKCLTVRRLYVR